MLDCFCRSKFAKYLLNKHNTSALSQYSEYALSLMDKYVVHKLYDIVMAEIERLVKEDILCVDYYYINDDGKRIKISVEDIKDIENQALNVAECGNTYEVYQSKATKEIFIKARNDLVLAKTGEQVFVSRYNVNFSENIDKEQYQNYRELFYVDSAESQVILTKFFDLFRERTCFCLQRDID